MLWWANLKISLKIGIVFVVIVFMQLVTLVINELEFTTIRTSTTSVNEVLLPIYSGVLPAFQDLQNVRVQLRNAIITDDLGQTGRHIDAYRTSSKRFLEVFEQLTATLRRVKESSDYNDIVRLNASEDYTKIAAVKEKGVVMIKEYEITAALAAQNRSKEAYDVLLRAADKQAALNAAVEDLNKYLIHRFQMRTGDEAGCDKSGGFIAIIEVGLIFT